MARTKVLIVEDVSSISEPLAESLEREGFDPSVESSTKAALAVFDLEPSGVPVIMLTHRIDGTLEARRVASRLSTMTGGRRC
ncbi:MAG: response regulator transcription factor [Actinobacteria bacterium]|nr:MAG: response regulator transcription factor [Actinomycetota bacterium]